MQKRMGTQARGKTSSALAGLPRHALLALAVGLVLLFLPAATARAAFHEILVREVYAGGAGNDSYVVLQAYSPGQNFVGGHSVTAYDSAGTAIGTFTFADKVDNGQSQMTILVADTGYATTFPSGPSPDGALATLDLNPAGGAVCWTGLDCVAWGSFGTSISPSPGTPAGSPSAGMALRRTITGGSCSNRLDPGDDSNDSAADLTQQTPHPRSNASPIDEGATCTPPLLPSAEIESGPDNPTKETSAAFTYSSDPAGASFECRLGSAAFAICPESGIEYPGPLPDGNHTFQVRAKDANGTGPADSHTWKVDTTAPTVTIDAQPKDPSPGNNASFKFHASEAVSKFECSLVQGAGADAFSPCTSPHGYSGLADGAHTFKVRATDAVGFESTPSAFPQGTFTWTVDNSLADTTPPETKITSAPPDPSGSSTASFAYESNEAGSSFQCSLDGAAFAGCPATGIVYGGLASGAHTFRVQAVDSSGNVDPTPAGHSFTVVLAALALPPLPSVPSPPVTRQAALNTTIVKGPPARTRDRTPSFRFRSTPAGGAFQCKLDGGLFKSCRSPLTTKTLGYGSHTLLVRVVVSGLTDLTPARSRFKVVRP
jgi:hypothetical protein